MSNLKIYEDLLQLFFVQTVWHYNKYGTVVIGVSQWIFILLLLVSLCKLSLPMVGLYKSSLPTFALKYASIILMAELALWFTFCSNKLKRNFQKEYYYQVLNLGGPLLRYYT